MRGVWVTSYRCVAAWVGDLNLDDGGLALKFKERKAALWRLKIIRDTEAVLRRMYVFRQ